MRTTDNSRSIKRAKHVSFIKKRKACPLSPNQNAKREILAQLKRK
jgi:hypothetical protein